MESDRTRNLKELRQKRLQYYDKIYQPRHQAEKQSNQPPNRKPSSPKHNKITLTSKGFNDNPYQRSNQRSSNVSQMSGNSSILAWGSEERLASSKLNKRSSGPGLSKIKSSVDRIDVNSESYLSPLRKSSNQSQSQSVNTARLQNGRGDHVNQAQSQAKSSNTARLQNGRGDEILPNDEFRYSYENFKPVDRDRFYSTKTVEDLTWNSRNTSAGRYPQADSIKPTRNQTLEYSTVSTFDPSYDAFHLENILQEMGHVRKLRSRVHDELKINFDGQGSGLTSSHHGRKVIPNKSSSPSNRATMVTDENQNMLEENVIGTRDKFKEKTASSKENKDPVHLPGVKSKEMQDDAQIETRYEEDNNDEGPVDDEFDLGALQQAAKQGDDVLRRYIKRLSQKLHGSSNNSSDTDGSENGERGSTLEGVRERDDHLDKMVPVGNSEEGDHHEVEEKHPSSVEMIQNEDQTETNESKTVEVEEHHMGLSLDGEPTSDKDVDVKDEDETYRVEERNDIGDEEEHCLGSFPDGDHTSDKVIDVKVGDSNDTHRVQEIMESISSSEVGVGQSSNTQDDAVKINASYQPTITRPAMTSNQLEELGLFDDMFSSTKTSGSRSDEMKLDQSDGNMEDALHNQNGHLEAQEKKDIAEGMDDLQLATHRPEDRPMSPLKGIHAIGGSHPDTSSKWKFPYVHIPSASVLRAEFSPDAKMSSDGSDAAGENDLKKIQPKPPGSLKQAGSKKNVHAAKHLMRSSNSNGLSKPSNPKRPKTPERHIVGVREHHEKDRETRRPGSARHTRRESSSPSRSARLDERRSEESARVSVVNSSFQRGVSPERKVKPIEILSLDLNDITNNSNEDNKDEEDMIGCEDLEEDQANSDDELQLMQKIAEFKPKGSSVVHNVGAGGDAPASHDKGGCPQVSFELPHQDAIDDLLGRSSDSKAKQKGHPAIRPSSAGPQRSKQAGAFPTRPRPSSAKSKVAQYMDGGPQVKRRWATSSSLWGSRSTNSTAGDIQIAGQRSKLTDPSKSQILRKSRPTSAQNGTAFASDGEPVVRSKVQRSRPWSARASASASKQDEFLKVGSAELADGQTVRDLDSYASRAVPPLTMRLIAESPRGSEGMSLWQLLPDEILLHIFSYMTQYQLVTCAQTCSGFNRVALDESLWRHIHLKKRVLTDFWLTQIGDRHPANLEMIQCTGNITENGLRNLFRSCADNLKELNVSGCSNGELSGDSLLPHASRCYNLKRLDASWCNVTDNGLSAINDSVNQLKILCLNGCREVSDASLRSVIGKHGKSLNVLEVFGCFNLSVDTLQHIGEECKHLNTLNIGQCYKLTDESIGKLAPHLKTIGHLDLRGCKQIRDGCIRKLVRHSKKLHSLVLANCTHISNTSLTEIATYLPNIKHLDISGCKRVTNDGVRALATNCHQLTTLDISNTSIDHRSVASLASYCSKSLRGLKLNCCKDITETSIVKLLKHCRQLETVHLYGVKGLRTLGVLKLQYACLMYETKK